MHPESVVLDSSDKSSLMAAETGGLGLTEDSRTTDFRLGLLVLVGIRMTRSREL